MSKEIRAWMHMEATGGTYPLPDSKQAYIENASLIDAVFAPSARLNADGTWTLVSANSFAKELPELAEKHAHAYFVSFDEGHGGDHTNLKHVLSNRDLWSLVAENMIEIAGDRDAYGIAYDIVRLEPDWFEAHEQFLLYLSYRARDAYIPFEVAFQAAAEIHNPWILSLDVLNKIADHIHWYVYGWWYPPYSIGPYWWALDCVKNIVHYSDPRKVSLGIALFSRYIPDIGTVEAFNIAYTSVEKLIKKYNSRFDWCESMDGRVMRERCADVGPGAIFISDGDVVRHRLALIDEFGLAGAMLFAPGFDNGTAWNVIEGWKP